MRTGMASSHTDHACRRFRSPAVFSNLDGRHPQADAEYPLKRLR
jgi:hypothetical protein